MKAVIILLAVCLLTSCSIEQACPSYGRMYSATKYGRKAQAKFARHNKIKSLF